MMQLPITRILLLCLPIALSGCAGMVTVAMPYGVGSGGSGYTTPKPQSNSLYVPLNFALRANGNYDLRQHAGQLSDERIREFLSIGIRALSSEFGTDATEWKVTVAQSTSPEPEPESRLAALLGYPTRIIPLDYKVTCNLASPSTIKLNFDGASAGQLKLITIDRLDSARFDYKAGISGTLAARLRSGVANSIFFDIDLRLSVERKSRFADDKHFGSFETIDDAALKRLRQHITETILQAYASTLTQLGLKVEREGV